MSLILVHEAVKGNPAVLVSTGAIDAAFDDTTYNDTALWLRSGKVVHVTESLSEVADLADGV